MTPTFAECRDALEVFLTEHLHGLDTETRTEALLWYCQGLALDLNAKTALGMAQALYPDQIQAKRQRIQRALQRSRFSHKGVFARLQETVFASGEVQAYCFDDTGVAKKGTHSVGVHRQYSGTLGKVGNCQVIVSLHGVSDTFGSCLGLELYLPKTWIKDTERCNQALVPDGTEFRTKHTIALGLLDEALENGGPKLPVLADAGYGDSLDFRVALQSRGLKYVVAVSPKRNVWLADTPLLSCRADFPTSKKGGRPRTRPIAEDGSKPIALKELAQKAEREKLFRDVTWRPGTKGIMAGRFAAFRVRSAERRTKNRGLGIEEWLLIEKTSKNELKYYLSSCPKSLPLKKLVRLAKMRWHIERDYQDMKQKLGFDRYEGRSWPGLHRHLAMVALMHAFVSLHLEAFSPSEAFGLEPPFKNPEQPLL